MKTFVRRIPNPGPAGNELRSRSHASRAMVLTLVLVALLSVASRPAAAQTVKELFGFSSGSSSTPGLVTPAQGRDASLITTTVGVGRTTTDGAIFKFVTNGKGGILYSFDGTDGDFPGAGVTLDTDGNFYGTAFNGGTSGLGVLFRITPGGDYTVLYSFSGESDGATPGMPPIEASDGNLYGATFADAVTGGAIYKYTSSGEFSTILSLDADDSQGTQISSPMIQGTDGNLYGTASLGGANGCGTIFKVSTGGALLRLYNFPCGAGGSIPVGPLIQASNGLFYGTTQWGGFTASGECANGCGTIFKMTPSGVVTVLHAFTGTPKDGALALSGLVQGTDGYLYGGTDRGGRSDVGILYRISMSGDYEQLYSFQSVVGSGPNAAPIQHTDGTFFGTTEFGGKYDEGSLYSLDMGLGPFITFVQPTGRAGRAAQILGQGFTGATAVTFNGAPATSFTVASDTFMTAVIPSGATTGKVVVTTPGGALTSNVNFRILQ